MGTEPEFMSPNKIYKGQQAYKYHTYDQLSENSIKCHINL